jgi:GT2 family glycosyltransferase
MNIGLKEARGEWIVRLDAHSEYPRDYLFRCIDAARETGADNVGGVVVTLPGDGSFQAKVVQALTTHRFGVGNSEFRVNTRPGFVDTVPYGCYRREALEEIGRYYEFMELNEDYELNRRLIRAGGRIWLDPAIRIFYYNRASIRGLLGQAYHTGRWNARMWRIAPYAFEIRHSVPGAFVLYLLFALLLGLILEPAAAAILLAPYLALDLASSLQQGSRYGWTLAAPLIFAFPLYHLSYGLGILKGCGEVLLGRVKQDRREDISSPLHAT